MTVEVYERRGLGAALLAAGQLILLGLLMTAWPALLAIAITKLLRL